MSSSINLQNYMDLNQGICTSCPHLVVLAWMDDKLSHGQAQNGLNFDFEVKFGLEGKLNYPPKQYIFYIYGPNLWSYFERVWSYRADKQVIDTHPHTDTQTDASNDNTRCQYCGRWLWMDLKNCRRVFGVFNDNKFSWLTMHALI